MEAIRDHGLRARAVKDRVKGQEGKMAKQKTWKDQLRPFEQAYYQLHKTIIETLEAMSDKELEAVLAATKRPSTGNCSWAMYRVSPAVRGEATWLLEQRIKTAGRSGA